MAAIAVALSVRPPGRISPARRPAADVAALRSPYTPSPLPAAPEITPVPTPLARGLEAARRGKLAEAERLFRLAVAADPAEAEAWNGLGVALIHQGDRERGIEALHTALRLAPGHAEAHRNIGVALDRLGRRNEATRHYERFLALTPDDYPGRADVRRRLHELAQERRPA
jgi:Flp pilus assembly protein TadD